MGEINIIDVRVALSLIAATVNIFLGILVFLKRGESSFRFPFILLVWTIASWSLLTAIFYIYSDEYVSSLAAKAIYFTGGFIATSFLYFVMSFLKALPSHWFKTSLIFIPNIVLFYIFFFTDFIVAGSFVSEGVKGFLFGKGSILFQIHFAVFFVGGLVLLYKKFKISNHVLRQQLQYIMLGSALGIFLSGTTNIILPSVGIFEFNWLGPALVLVWPISITYAIFKHNLFNIKVIVAEFSLMLLWILVFVKILLSTTLVEQILSGSLLVAVSMLGLLLVRGLYQEIELRKKQEETMERIARANEELLTIGEKKEEFVSIASHQLRTPLTSIKGYTSLLLEGSFGDLSRMARIGVKKIYRANEVLLADVEDFLLASRIEQGRVQYQFATVELETILNDLIHEMEPLAKEKWLDLRMETEGRSPHLIKADAEKIKQAIENVVYNAIQYTKQGLINIRLTRNEESGKLIVAVSDTGAGISTETLKLLFNKFQTADDWFSTGVGLYVAKGIIEAHGGEIWASSKGKNQGTTFFVQFDEVKDNARNI